jgi:hypothetical protein
MQNATRYNDNKATIKALNNENRNNKTLVFGELANEINDLKLSGLSSKKAKVEAVKNLKAKYDNCGYEISLIKLFLIDFDIKADKIASHAKYLHKYRLSIKKDNLTNKQVIELFR